MLVGNFSSKFSIIFIAKSDLYDIVDLINVPKQFIGWFH